MNTILLTDSNFTNYQLGIIYSIGSYSSENKFVIRHKDSHYINTISSSVKNTPYILTYNNKTSNISYTSYPEILNIYNYLSGSPNNQPTWDNLNTLLLSPTKEYI